MRRGAQKILLWALLAPLLVVALSAAALVAWFAYDQPQMVLRDQPYDTEPPPVPESACGGAVLVFSKTRGFRHKAAIPAARARIEQLAQDNGWRVFSTENEAVFNAEPLQCFALAIWSNATGPLLLEDQRAALRAFVEGGGGFLGLHAAGDRSHGDWGWYVNEMLRAEFAGHTLAPQFQTAEVIVSAQSSHHPVLQGLTGRWSLTDEWYSFAGQPRGATILATAEGIEYDAWYGKPMEGGHPVAWAHELGGAGRAVYLSNGHLAEVFDQPDFVRLLENAMRWAGRLP